MAEEVEMTPVDAVEPPKADPLAKPVAKIPEVPVAPEVAKPVVGAKPVMTAALKPGLKLPPKPGLSAGLKLPPKPGATVALKPGLKLPPKPGATVALKPGLKLPPKPGATVTLKPGLKTPPKPVIRKPGATVMAVPLPKPVSAPLPKPVTPAAPAAPAVAKPVEPVTPVAPKPVAVDAQGVGKLPTVEEKAVARDEVKPVVNDRPKPLEALKSVTQKLKGITQEIPQQAILRKTGIIADAAMSDAQKEAAKHKTARISLSDAMGVAPVKNENAPMKTIRIKRPIGIPGATASLTPQPKPVAEPSATAAAEAPAEPTATAATVTQRKTLKIARPGGGVVRPSGKFGLKRPSQATTIAAQAPAAAAPAAGEVSAVADIPDMPAVPPMPTPKAADEGPAWVWMLSTLVQVAACVAIGALAFFLWQNAQMRYF